MPEDDTNDRYFPTYEDAEWRLLMKVLYWAICVAFAVAVGSGAVALKDYSQNQLWHPAVAKVLSMREVCRFTLSKPGRRQVTVDHDIYCDDKVRTAQFPIDRWHLTQMIEMKIRFPNKRKHDVLTSFRVRAAEVGDAKVGESIEIRYSAIAETNTVLARSTGHQYGNAAKVFVVTASLFSGFLFLWIRMIGKKLSGKAEMRPAK